MKNINEIIGRIKVKVKVRDNKEIHVIFDKDVAKEIGITSNGLAIHKRRGTIPYNKIMNWCRQNNVSISEIFYGAK